MCEFSNGYKINGSNPTEWKLHVYQGNSIFQGYSDYHSRLHFRICQCSYKFDGNSLSVVLIFPATMWMIRVDNLSASSISWVTITKVVFSFWWMFFTKSCRFIRVSASRATCLYRMFLKVEIKFKSMLYHSALKRIT